MTGRGESGFFLPQERPAAVRHVTALVDRAEDEEDGNDAIDHGLDL